MKKILTLMGMALCTLVAMANDYTDKLTVTVNGESTEQQTTISVEPTADGKYTLSLKNFYLEADDERMYVGNIVLADREGTTTDGITTITYNDDLVITEGDDPAASFWFGPMLGPVPIDMTARFNETQLYCEIHINLAILGQVIEVVFGTEPEPAAQEEVYAPVITVKEGVENTIIITPGLTSSDTETATTYYTTDGTDPSATNGTAITEETEVVLTGNCVVQAVTISTSGLSSATIIYRFNSYVAPEEVSAPAIAKKEGVRNVLTISVGKTSRDSEQATTYYNIDGTEPSATNGTAITEDTDVELTEDCTVKAITISTSGSQSEVVSFEFVYEVESGIGLKSASESEHGAVVYDLSGRRQSAATPGLRIVNGRKVVISK